MLGTLRDQVVFVGGMIRSLLVTDPAADVARETDDVDVIASVSTQVEYYSLCDQLRALGFAEDTSEGAPNCRWKIGDLIVDVMPDRADILGYANRWYPAARVTATEHEIGGDVRIRVVDAPHFVATKLVSFDGRGFDEHGQRDYLHHDMEDIVAIVDGREELRAEIREADADVREFIAAEFQALLGLSRFGDTIQQHLSGDAASQARVPLIESRFREIAEQRGSS